ncbi:hypothetical protein LJC45_06175, partial [Alistipes sp. OttesenSCG-928-B03]|nr:hypothetical protein [Alistipes sp. OttesenSCG-928-B03]
SYTNSYVSVGWLQSWQNDREGDEGYVKPNGLLIDAHLQWRSVGINNSFFFGDNMMPYYDRYGSELYLADPFYRTTNDVYNRLEVFWAPRIGNHMTLKVSSVHHYDGDCWNWQQVVAFSVAFGK